MADSPLFDMQAPKGVPLSNVFSSVSDPLLPPQNTRDMLAHFFGEIYDLSPESHLSRLLGVILGDTGVGILRKKFTYMHLSNTLSTAHFYDIDRLFADVFGFRRFLSEGLPLDPYTEEGDSAEWEAVLAADASYRNRVEQFVRGVNWGATLPGMYADAEAIIGHPVRIYELFNFLDDEETYEPTTADEVYSYGELEVFTYGDLDAKTYAEIEGENAYQGRSFMSRNEFIVRPLRQITAEEKYHLVTVLNRLKPAGSMMTIDPTGIEINNQVWPSGVYSPSNYWHIDKKVSATEENKAAYARFLDGDPVEQPRPAFGDYQGEEWTYNGDVLSVRSYAEQDGEIIAASNFERVVDQNGKTFDYEPIEALTTATDLARGRVTQDGVLASPVLVRSGT